MKIKIPLLLVIASFFIHLYLMSTHYEFRYGFEGAKSLCSISETLNCEAVSISPYSYFAGLPLATWGFAFHIAFLFTFGLLLSQSRPRESVLRFLKFFSLLSVLATVVMAGISLTMMDTYCLFCIILYILSLIVFILFAMAKDISFFPTREDLSLLLKTGEGGLIQVTAAIIAIPIITLLAHDMNSRSYKKQSAHTIRDVLAAWESSPTYTFENPMFVIGSENPKFTIVEFADYQCIHCKNASHNLSSFVQSRPNIQLQFYSFPLDGACNPAIGQGGNGRSCILAKAVFCAEKHGKGFSANTWIFDRFGTDHATKFEALANDLHLNYEELNGCIQSDEAAAFIAANAKLGQDSKVEGTPAIYVNGKKLSGGHTIAILEALYQKLFR